MHNVTVYIPGLFHFIPEFSPQALAELTALNSLLNYGSIHSITDSDYYQRIAELLGLQQRQSSDVPFAAISRLAMEDARPEGIWLLAEPVHLKPTSNGLVLYDSRKFSLSRHDALALASEVTMVFAGYGYELEVPEATRWYVRLPSVPQMSTCNIHSVAGRDIGDCLPQGEDAAHWVNLFNEVQMSLHDCQLNRLRDERGEWPLNSLWFWGAGELPRSLERRWSTIYTDDDMLHCLAMLSATDCRKLCQYVEDCVQTRNAETLIVLDNALQSVQYDEPSAWLERMKQLEHDWLSLLWRQLKQGRIQRLTLITERYQVTLAASIFLSLWRWKHSLHSFFEQ